MTYEEIGITYTNMLETAKLEKVILSNKYQDIITFKKTLESSKIHDVNLTKLQVAAVNFFETKMSSAQNGSVPTTVNSTNKL